MLNRIRKALSFTKKKHTEKVPTIENIAIFGYADTSKNDRLYQNVFKVANVLAKAGYTVVNGGGPGVMRAATLGAKEGGGHVIGITFNPKDMMNFEGKDPKNLVDELIEKPNYLERTLALLKEGQIYVIFKGGTGTISEFGMAWGLARLYFGHHKPLILYGDFWQEIIFAFTRGMYIRPEERQVYKIVNKPKQVIDAIESFEAMIKKREHNHINPLFSI